MDTEVILNNMIAGLITIDQDGGVMRVNRRAATMLRVPPEKAMGKSVYDLVPDLRGSKAEQILRDALVTRVNRRFDFFSPSLYNWFEVVAAVAGKTDMYLFFRDVTDRERAIQSEAVREALRRVLGEAPIAITITSGPEHRIELHNTVARSLVGGRDLEGLTIRSALPELDESFFVMMDDVYATGETVTLSDLEVTYDREGNGQMYTGRFNVTYQPMRDATGVVTGIVSTSVETTDSVQQGAHAN